MMDWIIWYDDGSSFSSDQGGPNDAPKNGVQAVVMSDIGCGRIIWHGSDYYCWHKEGRWIPHTDCGRLYYLGKSDEPGIVINGYAIPPDRFAQVYQAALDDPRLPVKVCADPREKPFDAA